MSTDFSISEESNDLLLNVPDIEAIEQKREQRRLSVKERNEAKKLAEEEARQKRKEKALKGMKYLLNLSEKYSTFFTEKIYKDDLKSKPLQEKNKYQPTVEDMKEVAGAKPKNKSNLPDKHDDITKHLNLFEGGSLRPYQTDGVIWLKLLFDNGLNGILADEMGLGKTVQIIALICHLLEKGNLGPYLIVAPLSTIPNWESEFKRFAPRIPVVVFQGSREERVGKYEQIKRKCRVGKFQSRPVVLTTYQVPLVEFNFLKAFEWQYLIIDEGHRIKNHQSKLSETLRSLNSLNRLLLTGTPLQNNITELWSLLNFILPHIFHHKDTFASLLAVEDMQDEDKLLKEEETTSFISTIHKVLSPFILRRLKRDVLFDMVPKKELFVYCPLSDLQKNLYTYVLQKNISGLKGETDASLETVESTVDSKPKRKRRCTLSVSYAASGDGEDFSEHEAKDASDGSKDVEKKLAGFVSRIKLQNSMGMLKQIVDHPYLVNFPLDPDSKQRTLLVDESLVKTSGKMMALDALLPKLRQQGHKVLIFSTLVMVIDLIEEFMIYRGYSFVRLDGSHSLEQRSSNISSFNGDPELFAFLISTRAGGLGLNLTGADTVIFFDRDWNPQVDIQAQDRCHRIGQNKPVMVYTLVAKNTIDEQILSVGNHKRLLEKIIIKDGQFKNLKKDQKNKVEDELKALQNLLSQENQEEKYYLSETVLDKLLDRSELLKMMETQKKRNGD